MNATLAAAIANASDWLFDRGYTGATDDECACILDPLRAAEALALVDHWSARCGLSAHLSSELDSRIRERCTVAHLIAAYPEFADAEIGTGGNCTALEAEIAGRIITITVADGEPVAPSLTDWRVVMSQSNDDGPLEDPIARDVVDVIALFDRLTGKVQS